MPHESDASTAEQRFGRAARVARDRRGWSQERLVQQLEEATGVRMHQTGLARLESGTRGIRLDEAVALAQLLGIDLGVIGAPDRVPTAAELRRAARDLQEAQSLLYAADLRRLDAKTWHEQAQAKHDSAVARLHALSAAWAAAISAGTADPDEVAKYERWEAEANG